MCLCGGFVYGEGSEEETPLTIVNSPEELMMQVNLNQPDAPEQEDAVALAEWDDENYQTMRIVLFADDMPETFGAEGAIYYPAYDEYIFQYDSVEKTREAYEQLSQLIPENQIYVDEILGEEALMDAGTGVNPEYQSWGTAYIGATDYLNTDNRLFSHNVTIAYIDTGIDVNHPWFADRTISTDSYNFGADPAVPGSASDISDHMGHGSNVAGVISANTPSNVELMVLKVYNSANTTTWLVVNTALQYAISHGADIVSMSMGIQRDPSAGEPTFKPYLDEALESAEALGIPVFCSAGNGYYGIPTDVHFVYPANRSDTIAIGAINSKGKYDNNYSNYGEGIDFVAPGTSIRTAGLNGSITTTSGTSLAAPCAAAAMCWYMSLYPEAGLQELLSIAKDYAIDLGDPGKDIFCGNGCVSVSTKGTSFISNVISLNLKTSLEWTDVKDVAGYQLYRQTGDGEPQLIADLTETYYKDYGLTTENGNVYHVYPYKITDTGVVLPAKEDEGVLAALPAQVTNLKASLVANGQIQISFKGTGEASLYAIYVKRGSTGTKQLLTKTTQTTYLDKAALKGEKNYYWVYPYVETQHFGAIKGDCTTYTKSYGSLVPVTKLKAVATAKRTITLTWTGTEGVTGYAIYTNKDGQKKHLINVKTTEYVDKATVKGIKNGYWVYPYIKTVDGKTLKGPCENYVYAVGK